MSLKSFSDPNDTRHTEIEGGQISGTHWVTEIRVYLCRSPSDKFPDGSATVLCMCHFGEELVAAGGLVEVKI